MFRFNYLLFLIIALIQASCANQKAGIKINVIRQVFLSEVSSASGIVYHDNRLYIVGDDVPWMYILDKEFTILNKVRLSGIDSMVNGRIPKSVKPDFESLELLSFGGSTSLNIFSSGSMTNSRDTSYTFYLNDRRIKHRTLRPIYEHIKAEALMSSQDEINIEGVAFSETAGYFLHRGNISGNIIAAFHKERLINYLDNDLNAFPEAKIYQFDLPDDNQLQSGFSGACMIPNNYGILFTASLESTDDVISDGGILGSYVGIIPINTISEGHYVSALLSIDKETLPKKLEGITIKSLEDRKIIAYAVCDNDDGTSDIFELEIIY